MALCWTPCTKACHSFCNLPVKQSKAAEALSQDEPSRQVSAIRDAVTLKGWMRPARNFAWLRILPSPLRPAFWSPASCVLCEQGRGDLCMILQDSRAGLLLLSVYQATLNESLLCLRLSAWALWAEKCSRAARRAVLKPGPLSSFVPFIFPPGPRARST